MAIITISGNNFTTYSTLAEADIYFLGSSDFDTWDGYTDAQKERGLISATRLLDRQSWQGTKDDDDQDLEFPRTGLTDCNGNSVTAAGSLTLAVEASQLLAFDILNGATIQTSTTNEDRTKRLKADTVEIEYFRADTSTYSRFDKDVMELVGCFLASSVAIAGSISYGTDGTALNNDFSLNRGI